MGNYNIVDGQAVDADIAIKILNNCKVKIAQEQLSKDKPLVVDIYPLNENPFKLIY
jgi:hypothetical protein